MYQRNTVLSIFLSLCMESAVADIKTPKKREALFEQLVALTMAREAWSPIKNKAYGASYPDDFEPLRNEFISAQNDEDLFFAIVKFSNRRNDRHLRVTPVSGGLKPNIAKTAVAPIRFLPDYGDFDANTANNHRPDIRPHFFVSDLANNISQFSPHQHIAIGDRLIEINGMPVSDFIKRTAAYHRGSTPEGFYWKFAQQLSRRSGVLPKSWYQSQLSLRLKKTTGATYDISLPYLDSKAVTFQSEHQAKYEGFEKVLDFTSFDFYRSTTNKRQVLFDWYGFRDDLIDAMDQTMIYAQNHQLLGHDVIWDGTRSRGGGRGAYAIQRLQPQPFKTTFGNLRISDVTASFVEKRIQDFQQKKAMSDGTRETVDNGQWLIDWLSEDVSKGIAAQQEYTNNVPFKSAHLPKWSDGILKPAKTHFTGRLVCWLSPYGGSHLDQFSAMITDNQLGTTLGMSTGGYSNTWEWKDTLYWPETDEPVVTFMWGMGHTLRPNGEILEGNPAQVDEFIPLTSENYSTYYSQLFKKTKEILATRKNSSVSLR